MGVGVVTIDIQMVGVVPGAAEILRRLSGMEKLPGFYVVDVQGTMMEPDDPNLTFNSELPRVRRHISERPFYLFGENK